MSQVGAGDKADVAEGFMAIAEQKEVGSGKAENVLTFYEFPEGLGRLTCANNGIESFGKQIKRLVKKQIQFATEEALEKRIVSMLPHYNEGVGGRKVRCRGGIVAYHEAK